MTYAGHYFFEIFFGFGDVGLPKNRPHWQQLRTVNGVLGRKYFP
jgi:hypothetical protein